MEVVLEMRTSLKLEWIVRERVFQPSDRKRMSAFSRKKLETASTLTTPLKKDGIMISQTINVTAFPSLDVEEMEITSDHLMSVRHDVVALTLLFRHLLLDHPHLRKQPSFPFLLNTAPCPKIMVPVTNTKSCGGTTRRMEFVRNFTTEAVKETTTGSPQEKIARPNAGILRIFVNFRKFADLAPETLSNGTMSSDTILVCLSTTPSAMETPIDSLKRKLVRHNVRGDREGHLLILTLRKWLGDQQPTSSLEILHVLNQSILAQADRTFHNTFMMQLRTFVDRSSGRVMEGTTIDSRLE